MSHCCVKCLLLIMSIIWTLLTIMTVLSEITPEVINERPSMTSIIDFDDDQMQDGSKLLTVQIPGTPVRRIVDPHGTWMAFMRHSERTNRQHRAKNARKTKQLNALRGPTGPQGPRGPPGPPGAEVTRDILLAEFRDVVREAAERKAQSVVDSECLDCNPNLLDNITGPYLPPLFEVDEAFVIPKMVWGFHCRLESNKKVLRRTIIELTNLYVPFIDGGFLRGEGIFPDAGRFTVQRHGVYTFTVNLNLKQRLTKRRVSRAKNSTSGVVRTKLCIDSLCEQNTSLESIVQINGAPWFGTLSTTGLIALKKGQFVSIYVDNGSTDTVYILETSFFSGSLAGL